MGGKSLKKSWRGSVCGRGTENPTPNGLKIFLCHFLRFCEIFKFHKSQNVSCKFGIFWFFALWKSAMSCALFLSQKKKRRLAKKMPKMPPKSERKKRDFCQKCVRIWYKKCRFLYRRSVATRGAPSPFCGKIGPNLIGKNFGQKVGRP